jgi:indolepyruvate ferredoxin oxidoreductase
MKDGKQRHEVSLEDKYRSEDGRVYLNGLQALVRLPIVQRKRDDAAGLNTAGFISGYRGSPLAGYDKLLWEAGEFLEQHGIRFEPGVNEELAATAVWGTQQVGLFDGALYDGVFALWYGKGPGVDRSGDALKHGNFSGAAQHGGVLVLCGDDHGAKSSTLPHQSEQAMIAAAIPVFSPAGVQELLDFGVLGIAASRFSGSWIALKVLADTADSSASVDADVDRIRVVIPDGVEIPPDGLNIRIDSFADFSRSSGACSATGCRQSKRSRARTESTASRSTRRTRASESLPSARRT